MKIAIKIGGSLLIDSSGPKVQYLKKILPVLKKVKKRSRKLIVGVGGGKLVRNYYGRIKYFLDNKKQEMVAIDLLRANARLLAFLLGGKPVFDLHKIPNDKVLTIAGITPGRSTDANTAVLAEKFKVDLFLILTDVNGIYTKDPKKYKDATLLRKISFKDLSKISKRKTAPGNYGVVDPLALSIISRSRIHTFVLNGKNPNNILKILSGYKTGTEIC